MEGGREGRQEGWREGREGWREEERDGGRKRGMERGRRAPPPSLHPEGRKRRREGGMDGGRKRGREGLPMPGFVTQTDWIPTCQEQSLCSAPQCLEAWQTALRALGSDEDEPDAQDS